MSKVKTILQETLRWCAIAAFGGGGIYMLLEGVWGIVSRRDGSWLGDY